MGPDASYGLMMEAVEHSLQLMGPQGHLGVASSKRHAVFIPSAVEFPVEATPQVHSAQPSNSPSDSSFSEDASTWEFSAPVPNSRLRARSALIQSPLRTGTPCQELASRYRAGLPLESVLSASAFSSNTTSPSSLQGAQLDLDFETQTRDTFGNHYIPLSQAEDLKPHYRQSRIEALRSTEPEARRQMEILGVGENDPITCSRPGCNDTLRNVEALMRHLHIHNIHATTTTCPRCYASFSAQPEYLTHNCRRRSRLSSLPTRSSITNPIKDKLFRVLNTVIS